MYRFFSMKTGGGLHNTCPKSTDVLVHLYIWDPFTLFLNDLLWLNSTLTSDFYCWKSFITVWTHSKEDKNTNKKYCNLISHVLINVIIYHEIHKSMNIFEIKQNHLYNKYKESLRITVFSLNSWFWVIVLRLSPLLVLVSYSRSILFQCKQ
jgi:hypothetical protein